MSIARLLVAQWGEVSHWWPWGAVRSAYNKTAVRCRYSPLTHITAINWPSVSLSVVCELNTCQLQQHIGYIDDDVR